MRCPFWFIALLLLTPPVYGQTAEDFFDDGILHEIHLDVHPYDWQRLQNNFLSNTYYPADMHWLFKGHSIDVQQVGIRSRGTGSRSPIKPGLLVDFARYNGSQRFLALHSVVLRNNIQDASMLHERLAFALMRQLGMNAPRVAHARLYLNGRYLGLYAIVENIDEPFLQSHFGNKDGYLYEYNFDAGDPGYLFEYRGADPALYSPKPFQPATHEDKPTPQRIEAMVRAINQAGDVEFERTVSPYLDLNDFIIEIAVEAYIAESDGMLGDFGLNNFYLYQAQGSSPFRIIPWDKSQSFLSLERSVWLNIDGNVLSRRSLAVATLQALFVDTLSRAAMLAGGSGGWLEQEIVREYEQIRTAAREDTNKQCDPNQTGGIIPCSNEDFESAVLGLIQFARLRNDRVAQQLADVLGPVPAFARVSPADAPRLADEVSVSQTALPDVPFLMSGRIAVEMAGPVVTGVVLVNTNSEPANLAFHFTDPDGQDFGHGITTISPGAQIVRYLHESPFSGGAIIHGSFTFNSTVPLAAVAIRGFTNQRSEFLMASLPVTDLDNTADAPSVVPLFADGGGWETQVVLLNPSDDPITGVVQFWSQGSDTGAAVPLTMTVDRRNANSFDYSIEPRSSVVLRTHSSAQEARTGSIRVFAAGPVPAAHAVVSFSADGVRVSDAVVAATHAVSTVRTQVESAASIQSGIAIANTSDAAVTVTLGLTSLSGGSLGLAGSITIPAAGQRVLDFTQVPEFGTLAQPFQGVLEISASTASLTAVGLRTLYSERRDILIAVTPMTVPPNSVHGKGGEPKGPGWLVQ